MKKLTIHEQKRLREVAALTLTLSLNTKTDVTKKEIAEFSKDLLNTIQRKRQVHHWSVWLIETDGEQS